MVHFSLANRTKTLFKIVGIPLYYALLAVVVITVTIILKSLSITKHLFKIFRSTLLRQIQLYRRVYQKNRNGTRKTIYLFFHTKLSRFHLQNRPGKKRYKKKEPIILFDQTKTFPSLIKRLSSFFTLQCPLLNLF